YPDWVGNFYPSGTTSAAFLSAYAQRYNVVEVDNTFYRIPGRKMVEGWRDKTPSAFGFSLKVTQSITHEKILINCKEEVARFLDAVGVLEDKLICCLLQFSYFNRKAFTDQKGFLDRLDPFLASWPKSFPLAVEIRNKNWMNREFADCLRRHGAVWA